MGIFAKGPGREERPEAGSGLEVDLDEKACPTCGRLLHPWEPTCPDDGATAVDRWRVARSDLPPPPPNLLADDDADGQPDTDDGDGR